MTSAETLAGQDSGTVGLTLERSEGLLCTTILASMIEYSLYYHTSPVRESKVCNLGGEEHVPGGQVAVEDGVGGQVLHSASNLGGEEGEKVSLIPGSSMRAHEVLSCTTSIFMGRGKK